MATVSIREARSHCLGARNEISVKRHLFQYIYGPIDRELRVRRHIELMQGEAIDLHVFLVGHEPGFAGWWSEEEAARTQHAIDVMREIYAQVGLGVRNIDWRYIDTDTAAGYFSVDGAEATDLTEEFSGPGPGIDVFFVQDVSDAGGWSNSLGPCNKNLPFTRTGAVLETRTNLLFGGILLAHEVGHYLTLGHGDDVSDITNVMGHDADGDGIGTINSSSTGLTSAQGTTMKASCFIRPAC